MPGRDPRSYLCTIARIKEENVTQIGRLLVHTGDGKGKTTAALGLALRAVGHGMRVLIVQFIKGNWATGELCAARRLEPELKMISMGRGFTWTHESQEEDRRAAAEAWEACRRALDTGEYELVIMDEINYAIHYGFLDVAAVVEALRTRPPGVHAVLTGRNAHPDIVALADTVTEMRSVKHAFADNGTKAVKGIEY
jgi:cob(I)alamin adenosyltransferase